MEKYQASHSLSAMSEPLVVTAVGGGKMIKVAF